MLSAFGGAHHRGKAIRQPVSQPAQGKLGSPYCICITPLALAPPVSKRSDGALGSLGSIIYASISILPPACLARCVRALTVVDGSATGFDVFDGFQAKHVSGMHKPYGHRTGSEDH